jgi:hypothetical protein
LRLVALVRFSCFLLFGYQFRTDRKSSNEIAGNSTYSLCFIQKIPPQRSSRKHERKVQKNHNIYTILAEKIETILARNISNTRARDFYDVYILLSLNGTTLSRTTLLHSLQEKAIERSSLPVIDDYAKHLKNIADSSDIAKIWNNYTKKYPYAKGVSLADIVSLIDWIFEQTL